MAENGAGVPPCSGLCAGDDWRIVICNEACHDFFAALRPGKCKRRNLEGTSLFALFDDSGCAKVKERILACPQCGCVNLEVGERRVMFTWAEGHGGGHMFLFHEIGGASAAAASETYDLLSRELQVIIDSIHDGIWVIDGDGLTVYVNKAMKRIAGIEPSEMIGKHVTLPVTEGKFTSAVTLTALEQKKAVTMFDDYACGTRCLNTSTPIFDEQGNIRRVVASIRDMTELATLQERLVKAELEAHSYKARLENMLQDKTPGFIANSRVMRRCAQELEKAARVPSGVLLLGETGTGKTFAASNIHRKSPRSAMPFISVNCAAIPQALLESELFGYERGAFTGAGQGGKKGFFELADKGTLLLDEIGELPVSMQAKLLHVLDSQTFHKIGSEKTVKVDVRVIAATNRPLEQLVAAGEFRADLYYRLRVLMVALPPLRERPEDIPELAMTFLSEACARYGTVKTFSPRVLRYFTAYNWPGNVRELRAAVEFLAAMTEGSMICLADLPQYIADNAPPPPPNSEEEASTSLKAAVESLERGMIRNALTQAGSTYKAAKLLGISQSSVVRKAQQLGIGPVKQTDQ